MACDLQATLGMSQKMKLSTKIWRFEPNLVFDECEYLVGICGSVNEMMDIVDFFSHPDVYTKPPKIQDSGGLVLTQKGEIYYFSQPHKWMKIKEKHHSIGSGSSTALGALLVGAEPKEAIVAASKVDPLTGMGVKVFKF